MTTADKAMSTYLRNLWTLCMDGRLETLPAVKAIPSFHPEIAHGCDGAWSMDAKPENLIVERLGQALVIYNTKDFVQHIMIGKAYKKTRLSDFLKQLNLNFGKLKGAVIISSYAFAQFEETSKLDLKFCTVEKM